MKKEIKEILADDLKAMTLKFDYVEDTQEDVWFPINPFWSVGFSKLTTETYTYMFFSLLNRETGYVVRKLFIRREFDKAKCEFKFRIVGIMYRYGREVHKLDLDDLYLVTLEQLEYVIDDVMTSPYVNALYEGVAASDL